MALPAAAPPFLTAPSRGIGGRIKENPADFIVEEIPLYEPGGVGTHLFLFIEKTGISTFEAIQRLSRALGRAQRDFGVAGLKDAAATTRQYVSIEHVSAEEALALDVPGIRILKATLHRNKLKRGHLRGNRFRIVIRKTAPGASAAARRILDQLVERGVPNYFGPQRFGLLGNTHLLGKALFFRDFEGFARELITAPRELLDREYEEVAALFRKGSFLEASRVLGRSYRYERRVLEVLDKTRGDWKRAALSLDRRILELYLSAYQAHLFNRLLSMRIDEIDRVEEGDAAFLHRNGACFIVRDADAESERVKRFEISPSGPLFGANLLAAQGRPGEMEKEIFEEEGIARGFFRGIRGISLRGARRPLRVPLRSSAASAAGEDALSLPFELPSGSYATVVLREIMKNSEPDLSASEGRE